jgi:hypothetical protein
MKNISIIVPKEFNEAVSENLSEILGDDWSLKCLLEKDGEPEFYIYRTPLCDEAYKFAYLVESVYVPEEPDEDEIVVDDLINKPTVGLKTIRASSKDFSSLGVGLLLVEA